jgi:hypothetical protein
MSPEDTGQGGDAGEDRGDDVADDPSYGRPLRIFSIVFALLLLATCAGAAALRLYANWPIGS